MEHKGREGGENKVKNKGRKIGKNGCGIKEERTDGE